MSENKKQLIENFILKRLSSEEQAEFEKSLTSDEELRKEVDLQSIIIKGAKSAGRDQLKDRLKNIHQEVHRSTPVKKISPQRRIISWLSAAAAIALLILGGTYLIQSNTTSFEELYAQNYEAYPLSLASRGTPEEQMTAKLNQLYKNGDYRTALPMLNQMLSTEPNNARLLMAAGICQLELQQPEKARSHFTAIIQANDLRLQDTARWYTALSFIQQKQSDAARPFLQDLANNPNSDQHQIAQKLLASLEKL